MNITIGINGVVVHTQAWTVSSGARDIEFSISTAESTALIASPPTGSYARCYVAFHDSENNEIVIRHFSLKLVDAVPKIPEAEIPDSIARDDEVTAAIAAALAAHPGAFSANLPLGNYENANGGAISGHYVRTNTRVDLSYTNIANENKETEIRGIQVGFGLAFGDKIFVIEWTNQNAAYREFNGFWAAGEVDTTAESSQISIKVIEHELRMIRFMTASQLKGLLPEVQQAHDKTVDIHLQETIGEFANMNDATIAGIALILKTTESDRALSAGTYNFGALTWQTTSVDIPNDSNQYYVVARIAKAQGRIETQFRVTNNSDSEPTEYLRGAIQEDANWRYYRVVGDYNNVWTLQRRGTTTHTRLDAPLGDIPIRQIEALIPDVPEYEGLTPQQKAQFESLVAKTADLLIETRETWVAATDASFLALPADNAQLLRVRSGNVPQGLTGWTTDVTTTEPRVILIRVPATAQLADYRILLGDDNAVRLDSFGVDATGSNYAYMTSTSLVLQAASRIRLQHHGNATHTRFIGMLADAIMARLLPDLPAEGSRDNKIPKFDGNVLGWELDAGGTGGGLTSDQVTAIANARAAARFTDEEKTKLAAAVITSDLDPYGLGFIGIYPRYMRFDQLDENIIIAFGEVHEPYDEANRIEVSFNGVQVVRNEFSPTTRFFRFGIESVNATNIKNNTDRDAQHWNVQITFFKDGFLDNQVIGNIRTIPVIINRELEPPDIFAIQSQLSRVAKWADIADDTAIPDNYIVRHSNRYFGAKVAHTKTASHVAPTGDPTNWIELSNGAATFSTAQLARLLPELPAEGSRDNKAVIFDGDNLAWELLTAGGLTAGQIARLLPTLPAEGSRDDKIPKFNGNTLGWETPVVSQAAWDDLVARGIPYFRAADPQDSFGSDNQWWYNLAAGKLFQKRSGSWVLVTDLALESELQAIRQLPTLPAEGSRNDKFPIFQNDTLMWENFPTITTIAGEWNTIAARTTIAIGTIVRHGGNYYGCIITHTKSSNGPDGDPTNWQLLSAYQGVWAAGYYHAGSIAVRGAGLYLALHNVGNTDPAPDASTNVKWLQINNVDPPVRYAELTINSAVALSKTYASLTFAAALAKSQNATGVIARATSGSAITIAAGSYVVDTHIVLAGSRSNVRSNYDVQLYDGTNIIDEKTHLGYVRLNTELGDEAFSSHHILTVAQTTALQVRTKISNTGGPDSINTATGGTVIVRKL